MKGLPEIAIPSRERPKEQLTLEYLSKIRYPREKIRLFLDSDAEARAYARWRNYVAEIVVEPASGITQKRNQILDFYDEGQRLIMLDDDLKGFYVLSRRRLRELTASEVFDFIYKGFAVAEMVGTKLWGIYPVFNHFFMKPRIAIGRYFIIGSFMALVKSAIRFDERLPLKQDYDFTLSHCAAYGKVVRLDYIVGNFRHYNRGGVERLRKAGKEREAYQYLLRKWGPWVRPNPRRENELLIVEG